jgi:hypothetical protein
VIRNGLLLIALIVGVVFLVEFVSLAFNPPPAAEDAPRHGYTVAWLVWLTVSIVGFVAIEAVALFNDEGGDTLTEHVQWISGRSTGLTVALIAGLSAFFLWFVSHLFGRDSRVWRYLNNDEQDE